MRQPAGQLADRFHLLGLAQLFLDLVGSVRSRTKPVKVRLPLVYRLADRQLHRENGPSLRLPCTTRP